MRPRAPSPRPKTGTAGDGPADSTTVVIGLDGSSVVRRFLPGLQGSPAAGRPGRRRVHQSRSRGHYDAGMLREAAG